MHITSITEIHKISHIAIIDVIQYRFFMSTEEFIDMINLALRNPGLNRYQDYLVIVTNDVVVFEDQSAQNADEKVIMMLYFISTEIIQEIHIHKEITRTEIYTRGLSTKNWIMFQ